MNAHAFLLPGMLLACFILFPPEGNASSSQIPADPNSIASGFEFCGTLHLKAGDRISIKWFDIGGFIEVRNESRFNQGLFPNHNWRGFISGLFTWPVIRQMQYSFSLATGFEHESSHATMGIVENTKDPFDMVYDHNYRKSALNELPVRAQLDMFDQTQRLSIRGGFGWYFLSKNTPELEGLAVANSGGLMLSGTYRYLFSQRLGCFFSLHERLIFRSPAEIEGMIYIKGDRGPENVTRQYPVVRQVNTITMLGGISLSLFQSRRLLDIYIRYLYGHCYGYIDSREKRSVFAAGMALHGL
jgi:hypothetical protein